MISELAAGWRARRAAGAGRTGSIAAPDMLRNRGAALPDRFPVSRATGTR